MTREEITKLIADGKRVYWDNKAYRVVYKMNDLFITCVYNKSMTYLEKGQEENCFIE